MAGTFTPLRYRDPFQAGKDDALAMCESGMHWLATSEPDEPKPGPYSEGWKAGCEQYERERGR